MARRVALFATCLIDALFPDAGRATVELLERLGQPVEFPLGQTCCAGAIRHQHPMIARAAGDEALAARAEATAAKTYELSQFLIDVLDTDDVGAYFPHRVTYHPTCHSLRMLGVGDGPLRLLRNVRGIDLVELPRWDECCGFGGTFAIKNADPPFPENARRALTDAQLRRNLRKATTTIRERRDELIGEMADWQELRAAGAAIKDDVLTAPQRLEVIVAE